MAIGGEGSEGGGRGKGKRGRKRGGKGHYELRPSTDQMLNHIHTMV